METPEKKGKFFTMAGKEEDRLCKKLIESYHSDLDSTAATVDIVFAFRDPDGEAPAMEKDGHRILGQAKITSLKDRTKGMKDGEIMLDGDAWTGLTDKVKAALMDHELEHFECKRDKEGEFIFDDLNRPVLKMRNHDRQFGWFDTVAQRHRSDSMEILQLQKLFRDSEQIYLPFIDPDGTLEERVDKALEERVDKALEDKWGKMTVSVNGGPRVEMSKVRLSQEIKARMEAGDETPPLHIRVEEEGK